MKIALQTWGSTGDVRPFIALAQALAQKDHQVTLAIASLDNQDYSHYIQKDSLDIIPILCPEYNNKEVNKIVGKLGQLQSSIQQLENLLQAFFFPIEKDILDIAEKLALENDIVIGHVLMYPLALMAKKYQKQYITLSLAPVTAPSKYISPATMPQMPAFINKIFWSLGIFYLNALLRKRFKILSKYKPLPAIPHPFLQTMCSDKLNIIAASSALVPTLPDWPETYKVVGYFDVIQESKALAPELQDFLNAIPEKPLFMTFGSMFIFEYLVTETLELFAEAVNKANCYAIIQAPAKTQKFFNNKIFHINTSISHQAIFPHCKAVVHHGGAGTTHATLMAGLPSIIIPHLLDQHYWAKQLYNKGIALKPVHRYSLTVEKLVESIGVVLEDVRMQERAQGVSEIIQKEKGAEEVVEWIEKQTTPT